MIGLVLYEFSHGQKCDSCDLLHLLGLPLWFLTNDAQVPSSQ